MLTAHSRFVAVSILVSFAIALLPLCVDREGFYLPLKRRSELGPEYEPSTESREYQTPLARLRPLEEPLAVSPESKHSVLGQLTFSWVTPILRLGTRVAIDSADLYHLDRADRPLAIWRRYTTSRRPTRSLLTTLVVTFSPQLLSQALLALVGAVLSYAAPFFLQRILRSIRLHTKDTPLRMIYLDSLGLLISSLLHSLASNRVLWLGRKVSMRLQSLLVAELSSKALCRRSKSSVADAKDKTAASDGRVANMLTSDLESVGHISSYLDEIYTLPIGFVLGSWYLYSLLGTPALIGLTITVIYYPLTKLMVKYLIKYQRRLMALDDERVTMITEMFQGIRAVKLFGWQSRFIKKVRDKRDEEISAYWTLMFLQLPVSFVRSLTTSLILVAILAIYTLGYGHTLTPDVVFPSITVFSMVSATFNGIPGLFRWMSGCYVSLTRIESFMVQSQVQELADRVATTGAQTPLVQDELVQADVNMKGFTLSNITLRFPTGGLSVIVGPTGSGKSSLLSALIGEMTLTAGRVILPTADTQCSGQYHEIVELSGQKLVMTDIAYVAQEAWLRNATIRENILFGEPYQKDRYEEVLRVCALKPDLRILKAGDMTEIGERGVTLSGGQKQRVALARAVYSSRRILLIDDCLSAVDAHTGKHILNSCLLGQTHLMIGRTRVLVTHHVGCLPHCDFVAVIKDGCVAMSGSPEHIMRMGYNFSAELEKDTSHGHEGPPKTTDAADADGSGSGMLVEDEEREQGYVRPEIWLDYMRMCGPWWYWATVVFFTFVGRFASIAQDYWVRLWMSSDTHTVAYWLLTYVLVGMLNTAVRLAAMINENTGALRAGREYHERLFTRVMHATPRFFDKTPIGRVISRFSRDMRTIDDSIISYISVLLAQITQVGSVFVIISMVVPRFILIAILMTIMYAMLAIYYLNATRELKRLDSISMAPLLSLFSELITGVESIRAFGAQNQYTMEAMRRVDLHNRPYYLMWAANRWLCTRIEFSGCIVSFSTTVLILLGLDRIDAGLAGFVLMYAISFSDYMLWFIRNYSECEISMNAVERVNQYLVLEQEAAAFVDDGPTGWPRSGSVEVDNLVVEYVPGSPVLHNISFNVAHGEKIGVVGRTGAGKSTLSLAFLRFVEASGGCILVDGVDIAKVGLEELRRSITIIPQDPVLFNGTIKFNLDPFGEFPDELLWDALKRSHLTSAQIGIFTSLDAEIKENGQNLSLGQRQLVALARALVRRSRLIIMDEATASVDFDTDDRIQRTIRGSEFANSTLFCIAHRLRTIIDYDRVLVLDKGKIVEFDTPWNLLQRDSGVFRSMCEKTGEFEYLFGMAKSKC
ncbi:P-loop containing nucleoside triphosphate hydrolase protein [Coemansia spiralis]|nr:P-loop containing nucleoside triphosphate hydrolase protein [Coemansia spiralis]